MTVGELRSFLQDIDANTEVLIRNHTYYALFRSPKDVLLWDAKYVGDGDYSVVDVPGEPERVLIIQ